ncbi:MAG TPA: aldolase/citrate lyase family protein [Bacteroidales bacterium]|nr:aldolase/citrate lyase family protein [Bacteroidales bacterium]HPR10979.1 aldolase/citrate lyase family protein [Bacteroidales bacterium]
MKKAFAGNTGPRVRSDCGVTLGITQKGGINIDLKSKVGALYGDSVSELCHEVLAYFGIRNADLVVEDSGALPFVIMARLEAAIKKLIESDKEFLPPMLPKNLYATEPGRTRFSRLYLPGNNPALMINAGLHSADGIILDLEDSVAPEKKNEARFLVRNALRQIDFRGAERMVRINQGKAGLDDLRCVIPNNVNLVLIPKCESPDHVKEVDYEINKIRKELRLKTRTFLIPVVESALGVENAFSIAGASENVVAMAIGLEDFTADLGVQRTIDGNESFYARTRIVNAAKAARIQPIDSVFSDITDIAGLTQNVLRSKALGFEGMGCIHPRQIRIINQGYAPSEDEIDKAGKIVLAWEEARKKGLGVVALGTKMIDAPVVARALKTINLAVKLGKIPADWKSQE